MKKKKIVIFASALNRGGAERQLVALAKGLKKRGEKIVVVIYYGEGTYDQELAEARVPIYYLRKRLGVWRLPFALFKAARLLRSLNPSAIYSFLDAPNIFCALLKPFLKGARLIWSIRSTISGQYGLLSRLCGALETFLSRFSDLIVANSYAGRDLYIKKGFPKDKIVVIENGIDTDRFKYDEEGAKRFRSEFAIKPDERIILLAARLDIMKDHPNFLKACAILNNRYDDLRFICVGGGDQNYLNKLIALSEELGVKDKTIFTGPRDDMAAIYSSSSSSSSSSFGEGFSNTIAESMACGTICAVTDVGDSAKIVGDLGFAVPPKDPRALADAIDKTLNRSRNEPNLRERIRASVIERFSLESMTDKTLEAIERIKI
ncbi:MAG: glycosyltransferase, partial [Helicobacteraceae bacterium]|nr:glycosyltransferase [Helicobacteraceae bacterium]